MDILWTFLRWMFFEYTQSYKLTHPGSQLKNRLHIEKGSFHCVFLKKCIHVIINQSNISRLSLTHHDAHRLNTTTHQTSKFSIVGSIKGLEPFCVLGVGGCQSVSGGCSDSLSKNYETRKPRYLRHTHIDKHTHSTACVCQIDLYQLCVNYV